MVQVVFDHSLDPFLVCSLCFVLLVEDVSSQLPAEVAMSLLCFRAAFHNGLPSLGIGKPK